MGNHACHDLRHLLGLHMSGQRTYRGNCSRIEGPQKGRGLAWQCTLSACLPPHSCTRPFLVSSAHSSSALNASAFLLPGPRTDLCLELLFGLCKSSISPWEQLRCPCSVRDEP